MACRRAVCDVIGERNRLLRGLIAPAASLIFALNALDKPAVLELRFIIKGTKQSAAGALAPPDADGAAGRRRRRRARDARGGLPLSTANEGPALP